MALYRTTVPTVIQPIEVDDHLSLISINPVQNRVITKALNDKDDNIIANTKLIADTVGWSGKNKLNSNATSDGHITVTSDFRLDVNGTVSTQENLPIVDEYESILPKGDYILSSGLGVADANVYITVEGYNNNSWVKSIVSTSTGDRKLFTLDYSGYNKAYVSAHVKTGTYDHVILEPMIVDAGCLDFTYEPYHDSMKLVLQDAEVIPTVNLVEETLTHANIYSTGTIDVITSTDQFDVQIAKVESGKTYTITSDAALKVYAFYTSRPVIGSVSYDGSRVASNDATFTAPSGVSYVAFRTVGDYATPQLNEGSVALPFEPFYYVPLKDSMFPRDEQAILGAKNLLKYPYLNTSSGLGTITITDNKDGSLSMSDGTSSGTIANYVLHSRTVYDFQLPKGTYKFTGGVSNKVYFVIAKNRVTGDSSQGGVALVSDYGNGAIFTLDETSDVQVILAIEANTTVVAQTIKPMIRLATDPDDTYVPFAMTNKELTENINSLSTAKQNKTLDTPLTIGGVSRTTVEAALGALNTSKQNTLTFDNSPTSGSSNPVKSSGIYTALQNKQDALTFDTYPTSGSTRPVTSNGIIQAINNTSTALSSQINLKQNSSLGSVMQINYLNGVSESASTVYEALSDFKTANQHIVSAFRNDWSTQYLRFSHCTLDSGGYKKIGTFVFINMTVITSEAGSNTYLVSWLDSASHATYILIAHTNTSSSFGGMPMSNGMIDTSGRLFIYDSFINGEILHIMGFYISQ